MREPSRRPVWPRSARTRAHSLRKIFHPWRWLPRAGIPWRHLPGDCPPWEAIYQQRQRGLPARIFEAMAHGLREWLRVAAGRKPPP